MYESEAEKAKRKGIKNKERKLENLQWGLFLVLEKSHLNSLLKPYQENSNVFPPFLFRREQIVALQPPRLSGVWLCNKTCIELWNSDFEFEIWNFEQKGSVG